MLENLFRNMTDVVKNLLLLNVVMFVLSVALPDVGNKLALYYIESPNFEPYQLVSHFFMHGSFTHILFNMFALVMFGSQLERVWGPKRFLIFYFVSAIGALILHMLFTWYQINNIPVDILQTVQGEGLDLIRDNMNYIDPVLAKANILHFQAMYTPMVGASGAIMGLFAAFAYLFPNSEIMLIFLPIPIKAKYFMPIYMVIELFLGVGNFQWDNIAHFAHLGGALAGFIMVYIWQKNKTRMY